MSINFSHGLGLFKERTGIEFTLTGTRADLWQTEDWNWKMEIFESKNWKGREKIYLSIKVPRMPLSFNWKLHLINRVLG